VWLPNLLLIVSKIEASREVRKNGDTVAAVALSHTQTKRRKNLFVAGTRCPQVAFPRLALPTSAHDELALNATQKTWDEALPLVKKFVDGGDRALLKGSPTDPVYQPFNSC